MSAGELEHEWAGTPGKLIRERYRRAAEVSRVRGKLSCLLINDIDAGIGHFDNTQVGAFCLHSICVQLGFVEMGRLSSAVPQPSRLLINDIGAGFGHFDNTQVAVPQTCERELVVLHTRAREHLQNHQSRSPTPPPHPLPADHGEQPDCGGDPDEHLRRPHPRQHRPGVARGRLRAPHPHHRHGWVTDTHPWTMRLWKMHLWTMHL